MHYYVMLASPMEMGSVAMLVMLFLIPVHIIELFGDKFVFTGSIAASCQVVALIAWVALTCFIGRSPKRSDFMKRTILLVGYPVVIFITNVAPVIIAHMTGSFYHTHP